MERGTHTSLLPHFVQPLAKPKSTIQANMEQGLLDLNKKWEFNGPFAAVCSNREHKSFGDFVASQLKCMNRAQNVKAKCQMDNIIFKVVYV